MAFPKIFEKQSNFEKIKTAIESKRQPIGIIGLSNVHKAHYVSSLSAEYGKKFFIFCESENAASKLCSDLNFFCGGAFVYPGRELSFARKSAYSHEYERQRLGVLERIISGNFNFVVTTLRAAARFTIPPEKLKNRTITLKTGIEVPPEKIVSLLVSCGYSSAEKVEGHGRYSIRGEILDFFPPDCEEPIRVEFWCDEINALSYFNIETRRRTENIPSIKLTPSLEITYSNEKLSKKLEDFLASIKRKNAPKFKENLSNDIEAIKNGFDFNCADRYLNIVYPENACLFDYIGRDDFVVVSETRRSKANFEAWKKELDLNVKRAKENGDLVSGIDKFHIDFKTIARHYENFGAIFMDAFERTSFDTPIKSLFRISDASTTPLWNGTISILKDDLAIAKRDNHKIVLVVSTQKMAENVASELSENGLPANFYDGFPVEFQSETIAVVVGSLSVGFSYDSDKFTVISYRHGVIATKPKKEVEVRKVRTKRHKTISLEDIKVGDYIVHEDYGIGVFKGFETKTVLGKMADYLNIGFADGGIYLPISRIFKLSKYTTPGDDRRVKLNSLNNTRTWERAKEKAREDAEKVAKELAAVYRKRLNEYGYAFSTDDDKQRKFESLFEFDETSDRDVAISEVKHDMQSLHPMDRLLLGDVGFGKTEVALRGVFKCVNDGKRCAILVPTTILALRHFQTIQKRFEGFDLKIEMLSRFRTAKEKARIKKDLKAGVIDILVGTHGIISDSVEFRNLGLLVIDEEQRFGVKRKEKLKSKFPLVDVLTLSATPIPRTLNMAMSGIRDMSVLEIPPQDRLPVQTTVLEHDDIFLAKAIQREINRGGRVYYLVNRIDKLERTKKTILKSLPDARIGIGHGRMSENELSEVWRRLIEGEIDVLLCTTIIETGVDVPNANTLIIEGASFLGLARLHRLRGRVGRSARRAYAYLTYRPGETMTENGRARLRAIREFTNFGAGYHIARRDLQIRGAGEILGTSRHGNMVTVGYDMYIEMLNDAVATLGRVEFEKPKPECKLDVSMDMCIPESYISSSASRIEIYKRLLAIESSADAIDVLSEILDRFGGERVNGKSTGKVPKCVSDLVKYAELKARATECDLAEIVAKGKTIEFYGKNLSQNDVLNIFKKYKVKPLLTVSGARKCMKIGSKPENFLKVIERIISVFETSKTR